MRRTKGDPTLNQSRPQSHAFATGRAHERKAKPNNPAASVDATYIQLLAQVPDWDQGTKHRIMLQWKRAIEKCHRNERP